jgi:hypothetical protein
MMRREPTLHLYAGSMTMVDAELSSALVALREHEEKGPR